MSTKLLSTTVTSQKLKDAYPGMEVSTVYSDDRLHTKSLQDVQSSHEYERPLNNTGYGNAASFNFQASELLIGNVVLQMELAAGTYVLPPCWAANIIDEVIVHIPGVERRIFTGVSNFIQCIFECRHDERRNEFIRLCGGPTQITNPTNNIVGFLHLNVLTSSMDPEKHDYFPIHLLSQNIEIQIKFKRSSDFVVSGTAPAFVNAKIRYERANIGNPKHLKSKKAAHVVPLYTLTDYAYSFVGDPNTAKDIQLHGLTESGETLTVLYTVYPDTEIATNKNGLLGEKISNIEVKLGDRKIVDSSDTQFNDMVALWRNKNKLHYTLLGNEQHFYSIPFSEKSYRDQISEKCYAVGAMIEYDQLKIKFISPAVAQQLRLMVYQRSLLVFHNGLANYIK